MAGKVAVMGAGAVGCYYGAKLAQAGEAVTLIGRPALVEAVAARGLIFETGGETHAVALEASLDPGAVAGADLVLFAVKSGDTEAAGRAIAPHLAPGAVVLSLQNGVSNAERLSAVLGRPVVPVVVYVAAEMAGPGHMRHNGRGELILAQAPGAEAAAARLAAAGVAVEVSAEAAVVMWTKFTVNCAFNAISAVARLPYGRIWPQPGVEQLMRDVMGECVAVAAAEGIVLPETLWEVIHAVAVQMEGQFSSTAQDLMRGRPSEIDYLNGEIVRRAAALGLPAPANNALWVMVKLIEARLVEA
ncbi:2-dehydropantoate 2-reductase [Rhodobacter xanthinilyticus]|uniref:2-dehydropantoate 2-reductase n=1 Tax=Rhodobacter xanthinilyticus TaxID=1850250 RepID=A0A1D9MCJ0_9RHOB|nr:ketopantoate reductase family protein [Rhodobacter xanthinilyticus]AOZ69572.1 2-dehydropantoate 2-reductase [Rhodobacter xanthinilyticus]